MDQNNLISRSSIVTVLVVAVCATLLFFNCRGQNDSGGSSNRSSGDATTLQGTWSTGCIADPAKEGFFIVDTRDFSGDGYSTSFETFKDDLCEKVIIAHAQEGTFAIAVGETENDVDRLTMTVAKIFITIHNQSLVDAYNNEKVCGAGWEIGVKRQLVKAECQLETTDPEAPDMIFDIFDMNEGQLVFGDKGSKETSGKSESTRPTDLLPSRTFTKI